MKTAALTFLALGLIIAGAIWWSHAATLPGPVVAAETELVKTQTCAECHPGVVEDFATAPHARTLHRVAGSEWLDRFAGRSVELEGRRFRFESIGDELWFAADDVPFAIEVDWIFGSGQHALTPVSIDPDLDGRPNLTQLHVSWFRDGSIGRTPGSDRIADGPPTLGLHHDAAETERCFGCHASWLPQPEGRMELEHAVINLDCSRCHPGAARHAASDGELALGVDWDQLSPLESINRCGECHRRVDEFTPDELTPAHTHLVRFAPVGLALSPCFKVANDPEQGEGFPRFDCLSCHDPHLPTRTAPEYFNAQCRQCHGDVSPAAILDRVASDSAAAHARPLASQRAAPCSAEPLDSSCIECHMPKSQIVPGLSFTDHWIRVRE
ncbi:multiheme c-type cytochrome [Candidatus Laterigemmans baculatus]|uniref:multiheme c-type cytochrome n=1 Tax=Candidatus Laterigemmans baculatus TaxID=2770505 RepID=UPI0013DB6CB0|nr:multiheme c-type cytochrome [Candidatus Laterigemmans baculatus]